MVLKCPRWRSVGFFGNVSFKHAILWNPEQRPRDYAIAGSFILYGFNRFRALTARALATLTNVRFSNAINRVSSHMSEQNHQAAVHIEVPHPTLQNIVIRSWRESDLAALVQHANNPNVSRYVRDGFPCPYTDDHGRFFLSRAIGSKDTFAIELGGEAVGCVTVFPADAVNESHTTKIGYWLGEAHWNKGVMHSVVRVFCEHLFDTRQEVLLLIGEHKGPNIGSGRVLEKAGFRKEAVLRNGLVKNGQLMDRVTYTKWREGHLP